MVEIVPREVPLILAMSEMLHDPLQHIRVRLIRIDISYLIAGAEQIVSVVGSRLICSCTFHDETWIIDAGKNVTFACPVIQSCAVGRLKVHLIRAEQVLKLLDQKI